MSDRTEAEVVADLAKRAELHPEVVEVKDPMSGASAVVLLAPAGMQKIELQNMLDAREDHPRRRKGSVKAESTPAFVELVNRHRSAETVVYAQVGSTQPQLVAVLNDHTPGAGDSAPGWRDHRVEYQPQLSEEWKAWTAINNKLLGQEAFAEFLEDHSLDLLDESEANGSAKNVINSLGMDIASPADMHGLARDFKVSVKQQVREAKSLRTGETQINFVSEHTTETGQAIKVPGAFLIGIPVFHGGPLYTIVVRLRYRLNEGRVNWTCKLARPEDSRDDAVKDLLEEVRKATSCLLVEGTP
jgi:uncharacterized protein YfdQ (DUF2303 family)